MAYRSTVNYFLSETINRIRHPLFPSYTTNDYSSTKDGYNIIRTRIKWGDNVANVSLTQNWGAKFIHFRDNSTAISKIAASSTALLELQWHGQQPAYFQYSLNGSSKAISEIKAKCAANK